MMWWPLTGVDFTNLIYLSCVGSSWNPSVLKGCMCNLYRLIYIDDQHQGKKSSLVSSNWYQEETCWSWNDKAKSHWWILDMTPQFGTPANCLTTILSFVIGITLPEKMVCISNLVYRDTFSKVDISNSVWSSIFLTNEINTHNSFQKFLLSVNFLTRLLWLTRHCVFCSFLILSYNKQLNVNVLGTNPV